jgi:hypothetical protein
VLSRAYRPPVSCGKHVRTAVLAPPCGRIALAQALAAVSPSDSRHRGYLEGLPILGGRTADRLWSVASSHATALDELAARKSGRCVTDLATVISFAVSAVRRASAADEMT